MNNKYSVACITLVRGKYKITWNTWYIAVTCKQLSSALNFFRTSKITYKLLS